MRPSLLATLAALALVTACAVDHAARGREALHRGDNAGARRELARAIEDEPSNAWLWRDLARAHMRSGALNEAEQAIDRAAELRANDASIVLLRGQIRANQRNRSGALADAMWVKDHAKSASVLQQDAILLLRLRAVDEALVAARRAVERSRGEASAYTNLAVLATEARRLDEAEQAFAEGRERHPKDVPLAEAQAAFLTATGRFEEARKAYGELLARHPKPGLIHLALALLAHAAGDLPDASDHAQKAVDLLGHERADVHYTYVVVLRDGGDLETARSQLKKARRKFPYDEDLRGLERELR